MSAALAAEIREDPRFGPAVMWLTFELQCLEYKAAFVHIWRGVMKDRGVTEEAVRTFLDLHRPALEEFVRQQALSPERRTP